MCKNRPGSLTFVGKGSHSLSDSVKNERFSGRAPGTAGQTQTTQARQGEPEAGQTEQARREQPTTPVQQNGQKEARRTPDKAGQKQAKAGKTQARNIRESSFSHCFWTILDDSWEPPGREDTTPEGANGVVFGAWKKTFRKVHDLRDRGNLDQRSRKSGSVGPEGNQ